LFASLPQSPGFANKESASMQVKQDLPELRFNNMESAYVLPSM
jgi:hypothetical protein